MTADEFKIIENHIDFKVDVIRTCEHTGLQAGEVYEASKYVYNKFALAALYKRIKEVPGSIHPAPICQEYYSNLKISKL